ncbi:MAG: DUF4390 domain-containing protein [Rhodocyclaceae bacterium]|nr:DUF4390 domain-containing protein [Rhodocyclaceae bacterium]
MTVSFTPCWKKLLSALFAGWLLLAAASVHAGSIEPQQAALVPTEDGYALSAEFVVDLGPRIEEAVARGVPLYFSLEFDLTRPRWYWASEHVADRRLEYRLAYNALTRQYRLSAGGLHQSFATLPEVLRVISRIGALHVADKAAVKPGETYNAALRLSLDRSQLPKPLQVDALANREWQVDAKTLRWQFVPPENK